MGTNQSLPTEACMLYLTAGTSEGGSNARANCNVVLPSLEVGSDRRRTPFYLVPCSLYGVSCLCWIHRDSQGFVRRFSKRLMTYIVCTQEVGSKILLRLILLRLQGHCRCAVFAHIIIAVNSRMTKSKHQSLVACPDIHWEGPTPADGSLIMVDGRLVCSPALLSEIPSRHTDLTLTL